MAIPFRIFPYGRQPQAASAYGNYTERMRLDKYGIGWIPSSLSLGDLPSNAVHDRPVFVSLPLFHGGNTGSNPVGDATISRFARI
jgi:hypothetical protein